MDKLTLPTKQIEIHLPEKLKGIPLKKRMEFLTIDPRSDREMAILETWKAHFKSVSTPYVVEQAGESLLLIKERRV